MLNLIEQEGPPNPNLNRGDLAAFLQRMLPDGGFDPLEEKIVYLNAQGMDLTTIRWTLGLTPDQLADRQATINKKFSEDERVATSLAFKAMLDSVHPLQIGRREVAFRPRENDVFSLMAAGYTSSEIGDKLYISSKTADKHRARIIEELGARNRVESVFIVLSALSPNERNRFFPPVKKIRLCETLSRREQDILAWLVQGKTSNEISRGLGITLKTADNHRVKILDKLGTHNVTAVVTIAFTQGLVPNQG